MLRNLGQHSLTLERSTGRSNGRIHDGKVAVMASNLRSPVGSNLWRLSGSLLQRLEDRLLERLQGPHRLHHRWLRPGDRRACCGDGRGYLRLGHPRHDACAVERCFKADHTSHLVEHLSDNGSCFTARETRNFATALDLVRCFTPARSPEDNGMNESFV